ncbi:hypothetical protein ES707_18055 [subsurface metagenome]
MKCAYCKKLAVLGIVPLCLDHLLMLGGSLYLSLWLKQMLDLEDKPPEQPEKPSKVEYHSR